ncbi:septum formation protein Maf [candidate division WOR-3 bacterium]|nr:septum formation protein Maf [candidate division WOR-3 bacterium]
MRLLLASTSPRRSRLLRELGLRFSVVRPGFVETLPPTHASPRRFAVECARAKALSVAAGARSGLVIGVDTVVVLGKRLLGKPRSRADARRMLRLLSGRTHRVISGVAVLRWPDGRVFAAAATTAVTLRRLSPGEVEAYLSTPEPYDKAGAYAIQERAGLFVNSVRGCYLNVVGLPVGLLLRLLTRAGWRRPGPSARSRSG